MTGKEPLSHNFGAECDDIHNVKNAQIKKIDYLCNPNLRYQKSNIPWLTIT